MSKTSLRLSGIVVSWRTHTKLLTSPNIQHQSLWLVLFFSPFIPLTAMFILFASFIAVVAGLAYIVSFLLTPSALVALSDDAAPLNHPLTANELAQDQLDERCELGEAGYYPYVLIMHEDNDTVVLRADGTDYHMAVHSSWLTQVPFVQGLYWFLADSQYDISVTENKRRMQVFSDAIMASTNTEPTLQDLLQAEWTSLTPAQQAQVIAYEDQQIKAAGRQVGTPEFEALRSLPSNDTTKCLTCLQHHHQVGDCFCSSKCEAAFGAKRELVMEF